MRRIFKGVESGFTLIELLVVIIILGVLAVIAIPLFTSQQKTATAASLKSDLRNAATAMHSDAASREGKFGNYLPSFSGQSPNNQVSLDSSRSNANYFCLLGTNPNLPGVTYAFSSFRGALSNTDNCPALGDIAASQTSYNQQNSAALAGTKALIIYHSDAFLKNALQSYGYPTVNTVQDGGVAGMSDATLSGYKMILVQDYAWGTPSDVRDKLITYYNNGGLILQDGNDTGPGGNPFIVSTRNKQNSGANYNPTYQQGLSPSFPYTFPATAFSGDSNWECVTALKSGTVPIASSPQGSDTCYTMFATSGGSGRWVFMSFMNDLNGPAKAALDWLHS